MIVCSHFEIKNRDFLVCPKCECTYVKKDLFKRIDKLQKSGENYSVRVNTLLDIENLGHVNFRVNKEK